MKVKKERKLEEGQMFILHMSSTSSVHNPKANKLCFSIQDIRNFILKAGHDNLGRLMMRSTQLYRFSSNQKLQLCSLVAEEEQAKVC